MILSQNVIFSSMLLYGKRYPSTCSKSSCGQLGQPHDKETNKPDHWGSYFITNINNSYTVEVNAS